MTPNAIEILIHCHVSPAPHPRKDAPAVIEELQSLRDNGLIERTSENTYQTTSRGKAHINQLCRLSWPTQVWVDENGKAI